MKFYVKVKPKSKTERVVRVDENHYKIWVKPAPERGKANEAMIEILSGHLGVPKSKLHVVSGHTSSQKIVESLC